MMIQNGRVSGVAYRKANASGGALAPRYIVIHDTAGRLEHGSSVDWLASRECTVSAHFVVERDGTITQMVDTNKRAFHAGQSTWNGVVGLNACSIGIEIVSPGKLDANGKAWFGKVALEGERLQHKRTSAHGDGHWLDYTPAQIEAVIGLCAAIVEEYPDCNEIIGHHDISPGRKVDPNPLFPWEMVRSAVLSPDADRAQANESQQAEAVQAATTRAPSAPVAIAAAGAKSFSVRSLVLGFFAWLEVKLGVLRDMLPDMQSGVADVANPLMSLGRLLKVNLGGVLIFVVAVVIVVVIYRHSRDRAELARLKQKMGEEQ